MVLQITSVIVFHYTRIIYYRILYVYSGIYNLTKKDCTEVQSFLVSENERG